MDQGEAGTYDFAFIDADKTGYDSYYELCLNLMRKGGIVAIDNTQWSGRVLDEEDNSRNTTALKKLNDKLAEIDRVVVVQLNVGDGYTMATRKSQSYMIANSVTRKQPRKVILPSIWNLFTKELYIIVNCVTAWQIEKIVLQIT